MLSLASDNLTDFTTFAGVAIVLASTLGLIVRWFMKKMDDRDATRTEEIHGLLNLAKSGQEVTVDALKALREQLEEEKTAHNRILSSQEKILEAQINSAKGTEVVAAKLDGISEKLETLVDISKKLNGFHKK